MTGVGVDQKTGGPGGDGRGGDGRGRLTPESVSFDWLLTGLTGLITIGGYLLIKGSREATLATEALVSVPALILYAGALPAILLLLWAGAGRTTGADDRASIPPAYRGALLGAVLFVAGFVLALLDIGDALDVDVVAGLVSPGALILAAAATLIASGPVLAFGARVRAAGAPDGRDRVTGLGLAVAAAWLLAIPSLFVAVTHPWVTGAGLTLTPEPPFATHTDLYAIPLARPASIRLTATPTEDEVHPAVHPDGTRIAVGRGPSVDRLDVWLLAMDGTDIARVTDTPNAIEDGLTWSPDGTRLAWWSDLTEDATAAAGATVAPAPAARPDAPAVPGASESHAFDTWIADAMGARPERLAHPGSDEGVESWSPDGTRLCGWLFVDGAEGPDVHTFGLDGSAPVRVTTDPGEDWSCSWSPDGERLAFHSLRDGDYEIMTVAPDGTDERRLTDNDGMDMLPRWSPDGELIAFISDATGETEVYVMDAEGGDVRNVSQDPALDDGVYGIDWTTDGTTIIAASMGRPYAASDDASVRGAIGAIALAAVILGLLVGLLLRYRPRPGTFTIVLGVTGLLVGFLGDSLAALVAFVIGGLATDAIGAWAAARPSAARAGVAGGTAAAVLTATTFVLGVAGGAAGAEGGLAWDGELVVGVVLLAALVGAACAALAARSLTDDVAAAPTVAGPAA